MNCSQVVVTIDPPPPGRAAKLAMPVLPSHLRDFPDGVREEVAGYLFREYGPGELSGDFESGLTFRPDPVED